MQTRPKPQGSLQLPRGMWFQNLMSSAESASFFYHGMVYATVGVLIPEGIYLLQSGKRVPPQELAGLIAEL